MTIATDEDMGAGPVAAKMGKEPDQEHGICCAWRACARAQARCDQRVGGPFKNEEREIAVVLIVVVIEGKLLLTIGGIIGVIQIEHKGGGWLRGTRDEVVREGLGEPIEVFAVDTVLQTGQSGSTGQIVLRLQGQPIHAELARRSRHKLFASLPSA
jgi:hypothetical protein